MKKIKKPFLFALFCLPAALVGGFLVLQYQLELFPPETVQELISQTGSKEALLAIGLIQTCVCVMLAAFFGFIFANKLGLWHGIRFQNRQLQKALIYSVAAGILFSLDYWTFGTAVPEIRKATLTGMTAYGVLSSVIYGGIIEEILLRLFFMSLIAFLLWKLFRRKENTSPAGALISANVLAALLFAAGHIPATVTAFGCLTPLLIFRCFLLNGGFGLLFGWLYRKYGIQYAMLGHAMCHIVSKLIWFVFL